MTDRRASAGGGLLGPLGLSALALLVVNDHVLKPAFATWWTGKLSDVAALVLAPLTAQAAWELTRAVLRRRGSPSLLALYAAALATGAGLAAMKLSAAANSMYEVGLGAAQWLPTAALALLLRDPLPQPWTVQSVVDPTDLLALPALALPLVAGHRRRRAAQAVRQAAGARHGDGVEPGPAARTGSLT